MKTLNRLLISIVEAHGTLLAQGPLDPPAAPAPTMKSLQEIWDKIGGLETQATQLATQNAQLQKQLALLAAATVNLAWNLSTVVSGANRRNISLAFGQDGKPSLAYFSSASSDLRFARYNNSGWTITTVESAGDVGQYSSLKIAPDGQPAIAYMDYTSFFVRLARKGAFVTP